jgi:hypothetical protein
MPDYPALTKSWHFNVNQVLPAQGTALACDQLVLFTIVQSLTTLGPHPWQVRGSSNAISASLLPLGAAGPGTGWASTADLVWSAAGAHSWIVLRQTGLGGAHSEILISLRVNSDQQIYVNWSQAAGFTGGSTTVDPTATDGWQVTNTSGLPNLGMGVDGTNRKYIVHVMMSDDGAVSRVFVMFNNACTGYWNFEVLQNPVSGWTIPAIVGVIGTNSGVNQLGQNLFYNNASGDYGVGNGPSYPVMQFFWSGEGVSSGLVLLTTVQTFANDLSGEWVMLPIGMWTQNVSYLRGRHGMLYDIWWGSTGLPFGQTYAGAAPQAYAQFGDMIFPWNGTVPVTS